MNGLDNGIRTVEYGRAAFDVDGEQQGKQQGDEQSVRELDFSIPPTTSTPASIAAITPSETTPVTS